MLNLSPYGYQQAPGFELLARNEESDSLLANSNNDGHLKIEIGSEVTKYKVSKKEPGNKEIDDVHVKINKIKELIEKIEDETVKLRRMHDILLQSVFNESNYAKLEASMSKIKDAAVTARTGLRELDSIKETATSKNAPNSRLIIRILSTQHPVLQKQYVNAMTDYQNALVSHKEKTERRIRDQFQIVISAITRPTLTCVPVDKEMTDEEFFEEFYKNGTAVFVDNYIQVAADARQKLQDARLRHKELLQLEMSIMELHDMFVEMATLVESQGETIDRIENFVGKGAELVENGRIELTEAKRNKDRARKKKLYLIICLTTVLLILILCVVADFSFNRSN